MNEGPPSSALARWPLPESLQTPLRLALLCVVALSISVAFVGNAFGQSQPPVQQPPLPTVQVPIPPAPTPVTPPYLGRPAPAPVRPINQDISLPEDGPRESCSDLQGERPENCSPTKGSAPSSPGFGGLTEQGYASLHANGYGDKAGLASMIAFLVPTGNLNEPIAGLLFRDICNSHDACYAAQGGQANCDSDFRSSLLQRARQHRDVEEAEKWARRYAVLVESVGDGPYSEAGKERACAKWHYEMEASQCFP